jgi:hypothetical protein
VYLKASLGSAFLEGIGLKLLLSVLFVFAGVVLTRLRQILPGRRLWRISDPSRVVISVAHSASSHTGEYERPSTGVGQVRALALLMPSLRRTYPDLRVRNIFLSSEPLQERLENDLICLGSPKTNGVTADVIAALGDKCPIAFDTSRSQIVWKIGAEPAETFCGTVIDGQVTTDVGLVIRAPNPFRPTRTVIVLGGSHTFGTIAAARFFCEQLNTPFTQLPRFFVAVVEAQVRDGYPSSPKVLRTAKLAR